MNTELGLKEWIRASQGFCSATVLLEQFLSLLTPLRPFCMYLRKLGGGGGGGLGGGAFFFEAIPLVELCTLYLFACQVTVTTDDSGLCCVDVTGFAWSLKVWENGINMLLMAFKVCENWVGSVKVCEFCSLQSTREKLSFYQSETAFPRTKQS